MLIGNRLPCWMSYGTPEPPFYEGLTFTAEEAGSTITIVANGAAP